MEVRAIPGGDPGLDVAASGEISYPGTGWEKPEEED
jgi:hypothetical protein